jgi:uncharacterized damage-inducible protein DinB
MKTTDLTFLFARDFDGLLNEISSYKLEEDLWIKCCEVNNSAGNLALHICGNSNHFINHILGETDYKRDREGEFSQKDIPKEEIIQLIQKTKKNTLQTLKKLKHAQLGEEYPANTPMGKVSTDVFLIHLLGHLQYHRGQISYHRRLLDHPASL